MAEYYTVLTYVGAAKVADALSGGPQINLTSMAVGDGGGSDFYDNYTRQQLRERSSLVSQNWQDDLYLAEKDPSNPAWVRVEGQVPVSEGGWYIREIGIFDSDGDLIAFGVYPETYKPVLDQQFGADLTLRTIIEVGDADSVTITIDPSIAQATREWVGETLQPVWAGVEHATDQAGQLARELERQRFERHQQGEFTIYNRGIKEGCSVSPSDSAVRNVNLDAGTAFMHGQFFGVKEQENAASVPSNNTSDDFVVKAYLIIDGFEVTLATTGPDEEAPEDALVLAEIVVPEGNDDSTDPNLEEVTITSVVRTEPEWPAVQLDPAYQQQDLEYPMLRSDYALELDVVSFTGGEKPHLSKDGDDRATNTFRTYLAGTADAVRVRYVAHLMDQ